MDLDAYRHTAERFITELMREYYRHYAGLKDSFEIEAIYAAHEGLFTRDAVPALRELDARITEDGDERRRARMLFASRSRATSARRPRRSRRSWRAPRRRSRSRSGTSGSAFARGRWCRPTRPIPAAEPRSSRPY
jgi:hypothetical protein